MSDDKLPITGTTHTLPFDKLAPRDFERLCLWLVEREGYEQARHLGAAGSEQGRDIVAWRAGRLWAFQCKRVQNFGPRDALAEVEKVLALPEAERPAGLVFLVTCDVSANTRQQARERCAGKMECDFWAGTELDAKVKQHPEIMEEFFQAARTTATVTASGEGSVAIGGSVSDSIIHTVVQKIVHLAVSPWGLVAAAVVLAVGLILAAGISNIPVLRDLLPTPTAFAPASAGQSLIIVADFDDRSGGKHQGVDPAQYIYEKLVAQAQADKLGVRIERLRQVVDDSTARPTGQVYSATLVLWGWYDALTITPRMERIKTVSTYHSTEEGQHLSLADPEKVEFSIVTDLPSQATYLMLFTLGVDEHTTGDNDQALTYLNSALAAIPQDIEVSTNPSEAYFFCGKIHYIATEYQAALADYNRALELNLEYEAAYNNRGITYYSMGKYQAALADYTRALELDPEDAIAYLNRGGTYCVIGEYETALADCNRALELNPKLAEAYGNRGVTYFTMGKYNAALADFTRALELNPGDAEAYNNRGAVYYAMSEYQAALGDLNHALGLNPKAPKAYRDRGLTYYTMGEYDAALADLTRALELNPGYTEAYVNRGSAYNAMGNYEAALADFTRALELNPGYTEAYVNRGNAYNAMGNHEAALADFNHALELNPGLAEAYTICQPIGREL